MIRIFVILLSGWCRTRMRPARLVSYAFLYTTNRTVMIPVLIFRKMKDAIAPPQIYTNFLARPTDTIEVEVKKQKKMKFRITSHVSNSSARHQCSRR